MAAPMPRLVVLNSCRTAAGTEADVLASTAAILARRVPAVVAMQFTITDEAAKVFSGAFYEALVHNRGVDEAVLSGRLALIGWDAGTPEWATPVLYLRSRESQLFELDQRGTSSASAEQSGPRYVLNRNQGPVIEPSAPVTLIFHNGPSGADR